MSVGAAVQDLHDTIVAIASGGQPAARGIVRLSGPRVHEMLEQCFQPTEPPTEPPTEQPPPTATQQPRRQRGRLQLRRGDQDHESVPVDLWSWPTSRSYTGQPSAELHLIGIPFLLERAVRECLRCGARLAAPGEFTQRAFLAGRLDLLQAQAVWQVIAAQDPATLHQALGQLAGGLSTPLQRLRDDLIGLLAHLEAGLDFVDEDIEFISRSQLLGDLERLQAQLAATLAQLRQRSQTARLSRVLLVGPPNAGKSSLFNALVGQDAALVSAQRGTTRDYLSSRLALSNSVVELIDTAGLDPLRATGSDSDSDSDSAAADVPVTDVPATGFPATDFPTADSATEATGSGGTDTDPLDRLGQQQARGLLPSADVLILCWDSQEPMADLPQWAQSLPRVPDLIVWGKSDLLPLAAAAPATGSRATGSRETGSRAGTAETTERMESIAHGSGPPCVVAALAELGWSEVASVSVSAQTGAGLDDLKGAMQQRVAARAQNQDASPAGLSTRAVADLEQVDEALLAAVQVVQDHGGEELVAAELHRAIDHLGHLVGTIYTDDILDSIFSRFCIGK